MLNALANFAFECSNLTANEIYEKFEFATSEAVRSEIYALAPSDSCEPCRHAMLVLGEMYGIASLCNC